MTTPSPDKWYHGKVTKAQAYLRMEDPEFRKDFLKTFPHGMYLNSGLFNQAFRGYSMGIIGYKPNGIGNLWGVLAPTAIWECVVDPEFPLMWVSPSGHIWVLVNLVTDWGSIPTLLKWRFDPQECVWFLYHDNGYAHHGLYQVVSAAGDITLVNQTRKWVDDGLRTGYLCQWKSWNSKWRADQIWAGVRLGGGGPWAVHAAARAGLRLAIAAMRKASHTNIG